MSEKITVPHGPRGHYWDAPKVPATIPATATVVVKSRCGMKQTMPVWRLRDWEATALDPRQVNNPCPTCKAAPAPE